jgi:hypothetical protein
MMAAPNNTESAIAISRQAEALKSLYIKIEVPTMQVATMPKNPRRISDAVLANRASVASAGLSHVTFAMV